MRAAYFFQRGPGRFNTALLFSLLAHALLLSVAFGGQTFGLPGLNFLWKERRLGADDLQIILAPARPMPSASAPADTSPLATTAAPAPLEQPSVASNAPSTQMASPAIVQTEAAAVVIPPPAPVPTPAIAPAPPAEPVAASPKRPDLNLPIAPDAPPVRAAPAPVARNTATPANESPIASKADDAGQKRIEQESQARALEQARLEREKQSAERLRQETLAAAAQRETARQEQLRQDAARAEQLARSDAARLEAERQELARQDSMRRDALQKERARQAATAQQEAARQELERVDAARLETARREATRQEQARQAQLEAARQAQLDAARQTAMKQEAARQDAAKQEAARQDAIAQESARQDAAKQEAARREREKQELAQREKADQEAKREERLRAIGKQLNAEAAQRDAANSPSRSLLPGVSPLRRGWLYGRADPNTELVQYAEAMGRKIELNMTFDMVRDVVKQRHTRPVVTVAVRADGSVEKVTFEVSSGVAAIDEAIRKVVASQAPYAAFPPTIARQYDVIEIRRSWIFDTAIRLQ